MPVFQQELRKMQSSWPRSRAALTQQSEFSTLDRTFTLIIKPLTPHFSSHNRRRLEEKAKLYEQMTKGDFPGWLAYRN